MIINATFIPFHSTYILAPFSRGVLPCAPPKRARCFCLPRCATNGWPCQSFSIAQVAVGRTALRATTSAPTAGENVSVVGEMLSVVPASTIPGTGGTYPRCSIKAGAMSANIGRIRPYTRLVSPPSLHIGNAKYTDSDRHDNRRLQLNGRS